MERQQDERGALTTAPDRDAASIVTDLAVSEQQEFHWARLYVPGVPAGGVTRVAFLASSDPKQAKT